MKLLREVVLWLPVMLALAAAGAFSGAAQTIDPHALYEQKCARCHTPHARELVQRKLTQEGMGLAAARSGLPLNEFLSDHAGTNLTPAEIAALTAHFSAMMQSGWLFEQKCLICHDRAAKFARTFLIERGGKIWGRYSGREIETFMRGHGRLNKEQAAIIMSMFARQLATKQD